MGKLSLTSKDILLLLLYTPTEKQETKNISGRTRITKLMYVFQKECYPKFKSDDVELSAIDFDAWDFGPWSKSVYDDIEFLTNIGFAEITESDKEASFDEAAEQDKWQQGLDIGDELVDTYTPEEFSLSSLGESFVKEKLWSQLTTTQKTILTTFKEKLNKVPLYALLRYVYTKYPESTTNSKIRGRVLGAE